MSPDNSDLGQYVGLRSTSSNWTSIEVVLRALEERGCRPKRSYGRGWMACCPAHEDRTPSLHVTPHPDKVGLHCYAGCSNEAILDALALEWSDLFEEGDNRYGTW